MEHSSELEKQIRVGSDLDRNLLSDEELSINNDHMYAEDDFF